MKAVKMSGEFIVMNSGLVLLILMSMVSVISTKLSCIRVIETHPVVLSLVNLIILCSSR